MLGRLVAQLALGALLLATVPARAADEPYELHVILSMTGPAAFISKGEALAINAQEKLVNDGGGINGRPIHVVIDDDQSNPATAVQVASGLIARHVQVIVGPTLSATCSALLPLLASGPVMYCFANGIHPPDGSFAFSGNPSTKDFTAAGLRYLKAKGVRKIALLTSTDTSGQDGEAVALEDLRSPEFRDLTLVANEHFGIADLTVSAQIARIKAAGAEAVDAWCVGTPFGTVLRGIQEAGWDGVVMTNAGNINKVQMQQYAAFLPHDMIFTAPPYMTIGALPSPVQAARTTFLSALRGAGVTTPDQTQIVAWDPMLIVVDTLRHVGLNASAAQIRSYIHGLSAFPGVNGYYNFRRGDQRGLDPLSSPVARWDKAGGEFVTISKAGGLPL